METHSRNNTKPQQDTPTVTDQQNNTPEHDVPKAAVNPSPAATPAETHDLELQGDTSSTELAPVEYPSDLTIHVPPRELKVLLAPWIALSRRHDEHVWFDIRPAGIRLSATGDGLAISVPLDAKVSGPLTGQDLSFGVSARDLADRANRQLNARKANERMFGLDLLVRLRTQELEVRENSAAIYNDTITRPEDHLWVKFGAKSLQDELADLDRIQRDEMRRYFLELSIDPSLPSEMQHRPDTTVSNHVGGALQVSQATAVQVHRPTLQKLLAATASLVPATDDNPAFRLLEFRRGWLFGGNLDVAFWSETFFPINFELRLEKHKAKALASLLGACQRL